MPVEKKNRLFHPTFLFPMVSLGILLVAFLIYYFPVTARQEAALNSRAFRNLAAISDILQDRIGAYAVVLEQAVKKESLVEIRKYLNEQVSDLTINDPVGTKKCDKGDTAVKPERNIDGTFVLRFTCGRWTADVSVDRLLASYIRGAPDRIFDEVLLADDLGKVLYQTRKTGSRISDLPSFRPIAETSAPPVDPKAPAAALSPFASSSQLSSLWPMSLAGAPYKLYLVPISVTIAQGAAKPSRLVLGGLMRDSRFRTESMKIPAPALVTLVLLFLTILVAAWPLVKFKSMRTTERVPRRSAVYVFLSILATIILLCILAIHVRYTVNMNPVDTNLKSLAAAIERNFIGEVRQTLQVMDSANGSSLLRKDYSRRTTVNPKDCDPSFDKPVSKLDPRTEILQNSRPQFDVYPYFDRMFWIDGEGDQRIKWEVAREATSATPLKTRSYFQETVANHLWNFRDSRYGDMRFRVDAIVSKNTGEFRAVVSQPAPAIDKCSGLNLRVHSTVTPMLSIIDPVMPPDYGFAIVDAEANVQFHSDSARSLRENLRNELSNPAELQAALFARQGASFSAQYTGSDYRMFVTPLTGIQNNPWSLIVFYNLSEASALHLEQILLFGWMTLFYFLAIASLLMCLPHGGKPPTWVWPRSYKRGEYIHIALVLVLIAPAFYFLIFHMATAAAVLWIAFAVPVLCLGMAILKLKSRDRLIMGLSPLALIIGLLALWFDFAVLVNFLAFAWIAACIYFLSLPSISRSFDKLKWPSLDWSFATLCALAIMLTGVLPCVAFFKVAYDYHEDLSTRRQQLQTIDSLVAREERVKARYTNLRLMPESSEAPDIGKWLFVRRRLDQFTDRYDTEFLHLASGQIFTRVNRRSSDSSCIDKLPSALDALAAIAPAGTGALTRKLTGADGGNSLWTWSREGSNRLRLTRRNGDVCGGDDAYSLPQTRALLKSVTNDPSFLYPEVVSELPILQPWSWPWAVLAFAFASLITIRWIRPTLSQMFLLSIQPYPPLPEITLKEDTPISEDMILLGFEDTHNAAAMLSRRKDVRVMDFSDIAASSEMELEKIPESIIAIENFEHGIGVGETDRKKLRILERLHTLKSTKRVVIVTMIDPVYFFGAGSSLSANESADPPDSEQDRPRWWRILRGFKRLRLAGASRCTDIEQGRLVWSTCSVAERVALYQLAHDGWVNPRNRAALEQLQLRGLIKEIPFQFEDDGLRRFVSEGVSVHDRKAWEKSDSASIWDGIRMMFIVICIGLLAALLFFNQQSTLGYILTGVGVLTPLSKLISEALNFGSLLGVKREAGK
jgi:hypothetical protein